MTYNDKTKKYTTKYMQNKQVRVPLNWLKSDYEGRVKPAILSTGIPVGTYIKDAVNEKMIRDGLCRPEDIPSVDMPGTVKANIQKYINNDKKTVLYITDNETMHNYVKANGSKYPTWNDAIKEFGDRICESVSNDDYIIQIKCKEE